jgi:hypothetical protein
VQTLASSKPKVSALMYYPDSTNRLGLMDILKIPDSKFLKVSQGYLLANHKITYWGKFQITEELGRDSVLYVAGGRASEMILYIPDKNLKFEPHYGGVNNPYYVRDFPTKRRLFAIPNGAARSTLYLKCKTEINTGISVSFIDLKSSLLADITESWFGLFFMGAFFIVIFYNLIIFLFNKEWLYLYYSLYAFSFLWYGLVALGIFNDILPLTNLNYLSYSIPYSLSSVFLIFYTRAFFETNINEPRLDRLLLCLAFFKVVILLLYGLIPIEIFRNLIRSPLIDALLVVVCLVVGIKRYFAGSTSARIFILGFTILTFAYLYHGLDFPQNEMLGFICALFDIVIFSFALSDRYRLIKKERIANLNLSIAQLKENESLKEKLNTQLDSMVSQRTAQLYKQTHEMQLMNELLAKNNLKLESELKGESEARLLQKKMSFEQFVEFYPNDLFCYKILSEIKWSDNRPFKCRKCGYQKFTLIENYARKCSKCTSIESATAHSIFHNIKFPLVKAFFIVYQTSFVSSATSNEKGAKEIDLRPATFWNFKQKVESIISQMNLNKTPSANWIHIIEYSLNYPRK